MIFKVLSFDQCENQISFFRILLDKDSEKIVSFMSVSCMSCNMVCLFRSGNRLNIYGIYFT